MIVEIDKLVDQLSGLLESLDFLAVNTFCLEYGEEIFGHGVVIAVSTS